MHVTVMPIRIPGPASTSAACLLTLYDIICPVHDTDQDIENELLVQYRFHTNYQPLPSTECKESSTVYRPFAQPVHASSLETPTTVTSDTRQRYTNDLFLKGDQPQNPIAVPSNGGSSPNHSNLVSSVTFNQAGLFQLTQLHLNHLNNRPLLFLNQQK